MFGSADLVLALVLFPLRLIGRVFLWKPGVFVGVLLGFLGGIYYATPAAPLPLPSQARPVTKKAPSPQAATPVVDFGQVPPPSIEL